MDPEPRVTDLVRLHLKRSQREVYTDTARSAEEAQEKLEENTYDAVISEYDIGNQNAIQLLNQLDQAVKPFIIHSRFYSPMLEKKAERNGATFQKKKNSDQYYLNLLDKIGRDIEREEPADIDFRPDIVCVFNWNGQLVRYNHAFIKSLGIKSEELKQLSPSDIFKDKKRREVREIMSEAASSREAWTEAALETSTGLVNYDLKAAKVQEMPETRIGMVGISREELTFMEPQEADVQKLKETTEVKS